MLTLIRNKYKIWKEIKINERGMKMRKQRINASLEAVYAHDVLQKRNNGITLIALVITIIVLLILAGVSIAMLTGENGILNQANKAKEDTRTAEIEERGRLSKNEDYITEALISWDNVPSEVWSVTSEGVLTVVNKELLNKYSNIKIPSEVNGIKITAIGERAVQSNSTIKNIIIPEEVTELKSMSFNSCTNLEYVSFPQSLVEIGSFAFQNCPKLKQVKIPNNVTTIGENAFSDCINLKNVHIGNNVQNISAQAFSYCKSLEEIIIPSGVESFGWGSFRNCTNLRNVYIKSTKLTSASNFGGDVFKGMPSGSTIYVKNLSVTSALEGQYNSENTTISTNYNW